MRPKRYSSNSTRIARADLPVRRGDSFSGGENEPFAFEWTLPVRKLGEGVTPGPLHGATTVETKACEIRGRFQNCDVYITAPFSWIDPTTVNPDSDATVRLTLYAIVQGTLYPIHDQVLVDPGTLPDLIVVRGTGGIGDTWRAYALHARGRVCDGFRVVITASQTTLTPTVFLPGQVTMFCTGEETSSIDIGSVTIPADVNATIVGPSPLPVSGTVTALDVPATAWAEQHGTAPDTTAAAFSALTAAVATRYVEISAHESNAGFLYVASAALGIGASDSAAYALQGGMGAGPGDTVRIAVDNASKIFVAGSDAFQKYRVAVV